MYLGRGFKINNNSAILQLNVKVFTRVKVGSCTLYIDPLAKGGGVNFVHWFANPKVEPWTLYIGSQTQKWSRELCTSVPQPKSEAVQVCAWLPSPTQAPLHRVFSLEFSGGKFSYPKFVMLSGGGHNLKFGQNVVKKRPNVYCILRALKAEVALG